MTGNMNRTPRLLTTSQGLLAVELIIQMVACLFTAFWFEASPDRAYISMKGITQHAVPGFFLGLQYWGGQLLLFHSMAHLAALLFYGVFSSEWIPRWYLSIVTLVVGYVYCATGNFLLFDRHGVQSAVIEISIVDRIPFFGSIFADWIRGGSKINQSTLHLWYMLHQWLIPVVLLGYGALTVFFRRYDDEAKPYLGLSAVLGLLPVVLAIFLRVPLGPGAKGADFTSFEATVNWYAWPMHGTLRAFDSIYPGLGWIGALVLPAAFVIYLFFIPKLCVKVTQVFTQAIFGLVCALFLFAAVIFGGWPANPFSRDYFEPVAPAPAGADQPVADSATVAKGKALFADNKCGNCHSMDGSTDGSGPDLSGVPKNPKAIEWYMKWIKDPSKVRQSATMPAFQNLTDEQLRALSVYLTSPRK